MQGYGQPGGQYPPPGGAPPPPPPGYPGVPQRPQERPMGVTILAVLYIVQGVFVIAAPLILAAICASMMGGIGMGTELIGASLMCLIPAIIVGVFYFIIAWGLLQGYNWARIIAIIFAILGLLNFPIGTIISIIILIYLFKADVKAWFGK